MDLWVLNGLFTTVPTVMHRAKGMFIPHSEIMFVHLNSIYTRSKLFNNTPGNRMGQIRRCRKCYEEVESGRRISYVDSIP